MRSICSVKTANARSTGALTTTSLWTDVIVEQHARWRDVATGERQDRRVIGSEFVVRNGRVVRYVRHDSGVADALLAARLDEEQDLVRSVVSGG
jgi:ribosome-binding protein aMBF1 (putative translation factor)